MCQRSKYLKKERDETDIAAQSRADVRILPGLDPKTDTIRGTLLGKKGKKSLFTKLFHDQIIKHIEPAFKKKKKKTQASSANKSAQLKQPSCSPQHMKCIFYVSVMT